MPDIGVRPPRARRAPLTTQPQLPVTDLASEGLTAPLKPNSRNLVEQHRGPHMGIIDQPLTHIGLEPVETVRPAPGAHAGLSFPTQTGAHRLAVSAGMPGNGRDQPAPLPQRRDLHIFLRCQHRGGARSRRRCGPPTARASKSPTPIGGHSQMRNFSKQDRGDLRERGQAPRTSPRAFSNHRRQVRVRQQRDEPNLRAAECSTEAAVRHPHRRTRRGVRVYAPPRGRSVVRRAQAALDAG